MQRAMVIVMGIGFARRPASLDRRHIQIAAQLDGIAVADRAIAVFLFVDEDGIVGIESGMRCGKDETPGLAQQAAGGTEERRNGRNVHQGHCAGDGIKLTFTQSQQRCFVGGIKNMVLNARRAASLRQPNQRFAEINGGDTSALLCQTPRQNAVAAADIQRPFARLELEKLQYRRLDQTAMKRVALAALHSIPELRLAVPQCPTFVVQPFRIHPDPLQQISDYMPPGHKCKVCLESQPGLTHNHSSSVHMSRTRRPMEEILIFALVGLLVGLSKGGLGGPVPVALCVPLMTLIIAPQDAVGLILPLLLFADAFALYFYWKQWDRRYMLLMLAPGLIGAVCGTFVLKDIDAVTLKRVIGGLTLLAVAFKIASSHLSPLAYTPHRWHGWFAGWASGFCSALANVGAPPFTAYLLLQPTMTPRAFVGTTTLFFAIINLTKLPGFMALGILDMPKLLGIGWVFVIIPLAILLARALITRIQPRAFEWLMIIPLLALSISLLFFS